MISTTPPEHPHGIETDQIIHGYASTRGQRLRCKMKGHLWMVLQFDMLSHEMTLICNRCSTTKKTVATRITLNDNIPTPQAGQH